MHEQFQVEMFNWLHEYGIIPMAFEAACIAPWLKKHNLDQEDIVFQLILNTLCANCRIAEPELQAR